ncbi:MAG: hypothetical protein JTJ17_04085 [Streptococcus gordonii]|nr:hypothetical protein [Streptococcus gordonii]
MAEGAKNSCKDHIQKSLARISEGFLYIDQQNVEIGGDGLKFSLGGEIANTDFLILLMLLGYRISPH